MDYKEPPVAKQREPRVDDLWGSVRFVSTKSTHVATTFIDHFEIYVNGGTKLLRIYDATNNTWREITIV